MRIMKTEIKVIRFLLRKKTATIKAVAEGINSDYRITHTAVQRLVKKGMLSPRIIGNSVEITLVPRMSVEIFEAESEKRSELLKKRTFRALDSYMNGLRFPFIALVFGSHAKGTSNARSDIDIMVICEKNRQRSTESKISLVPNVHLLMFTPEEFLQMAKSSEFTAVSEAMKDNILMAGIEDYYRLICNG